MKKHKKTPYVKAYRNLLRADLDNLDLSELTMFELIELKNHFGAKKIKAELDRRINFCEDVFLLETISDGAEKAYQRAAELVKKMSFREKLFLLTKEGFATSVFRGMFEEEDLKHIGDFWESNLFLKRNPNYLVLEISADEYFAKVPTKEIIEPLILSDHWDLPIKIEVIDACSPEVTEGNISIITGGLNPVIMFSNEREILEFRDGKLFNGECEVDYENYTSLEEYIGIVKNSYGQLGRPALGLYGGFINENGGNPVITNLGTFKNLNVDERNACAFSCEAEFVGEEDEYYPNLSILEIFDKVGFLDRRKREK